MEITGIYLGSNTVDDVLRDRLQLDQDVVSRLLESDDWTMMILAWALVEACLNQCISKCLGVQALSAYVERLNIGGRTGKAELALALGLLNKADRKFLEVYSEVRNRFAHGVKRFKVTFSEYFAETQDVAKYENALPVKELPNKKVGHPIRLEDNARLLILANVIMLCINLTKS